MPKSSGMMLGFQSSGLHGRRFAVRTTHQEKPASFVEHLRAMPDLDEKPRQRMSPEDAFKKALAKFPKTLKYLE